LDALAHQIIQISQQAGEIILKIKSESAHLDFKEKYDGSPVTIADMASHNYIVEQLHAINPEWPIISEEGSSGLDPRNVDFCFLVDPLDGTKEFLKGSGMYTINIAVMKLKDNFRWSPILGIVHAPELKSTWYGGASVPSSRIDVLGTREINVGSDRKIPVIVGSVSHSSPLDREFSQALGEHIFIGIGSSVKICKVADGSADLAPRFGLTSCWDTSAAHAVLNSAGGNLLGPNGLELDYDLVDDILNPWFIATYGGKGVETWLKFQDG
jgi:3'(2'), 5'-bisphosphate nucleotidase